MKQYIYLVFFFAIPSCLADGSLYSSSLGIMGGDDIDAYAERPCHLDLNCIRRYFSQHSQCKEVRGYVADPFYLSRLYTPLAGPNVTLTMNDLQITGLNGNVTEFSINKKTNTLVIAVEMRNMVVFCPKIEFHYQRLKREPIVLIDEVYIKYALMTFTGVFPSITDLEISEMEVFTYISDSVPPFAVGPGVIKSPDPNVMKSFNSILANVPGNLKEVFVLQGPIMIIEFLQKTICDFGVNIND